MEIIEGAAMLFTSFVAIGSLVVMTCIFAAVLPRILDGLFED